LADYRVSDIPVGEGSNLLIPTLDLMAAIRLEDDKTAVVIERAYSRISRFVHESGKS